jgi:hypothetical protein
VYIPSGVKKAGALAGVLSEISRAEHKPDHKTDQPAFLINGRVPFFILIDPGKTTDDECCNADGYGNEQNEFPIHSFNDNTE